MKRIIQLLMFLCLAFFLSVCFAAAKPVPQKHRALKSETLNIRTSIVQTVSIKAPFSTKIILNKKRNNVILQGTTVLVRQVSVIHKNGVLTINAPDTDAMKNVRVTIYLTHPQTIFAEELQHLTIISSKKHFLQNLNLYRVCYTNILGKLDLNTLNAENIVQLKTKGFLNIQTIQTSGEGIAHIKGLASRNLTINNSGSFKLYADGHVSDATINQSGSACLDLAGISGKKFVVNATGNTMTQITGETKYLHANLASYAVLSAKFLKTKIVKIVTAGNASAAIYPTDKLFAIVSNTSEVKYLGKPKHIYQSIGGLGLLSRI